MNIPCGILVVVRVVAKPVSTRLQNTVEVVQIRTNNITVKMAHRIETIDQRDFTTRNTAQRKAVILDVSDFLLCGKALLAKANVICIDVNQVEFFS